MEVPIFRKDVEKEKSNSNGDYDGDGAQQGEKMDTDNMQGKTSDKNTRAVEEQQGDTMNKELVLAMLGDREA